MAFEDDERAQAPSEQEIRDRIMKEREAAEVERTKELEELSEQLDKEIEMEIRGTAMHMFPDPCDNLNVRRDDGRRENKHLGTARVLGLC